MGTDVSCARTDAKFWDGLLEAGRAKGVRAPYDRWYVIRGEQYLKAYPDTPLSGHRPEEVSAYLTAIGKKGSLRDWAVPPGRRCLRSLVLQGRGGALGGPVRLGVLKGFRAFAGAQSRYHRA